jgi:hypothetical protein
VGSVVCSSIAGLNGAVKFVIFAITLAPLSIYYRVKKVKKYVILTLTKNSLLWLVINFVVLIGLGTTHVRNPLLNLVKYLKYYYTS